MTKIELNKKTTLVIASIILILLSASAIAQFSANNPWHALVQISGDGGSTSVDTDDDGIIDNSSSCSGDSVCETKNLTGSGTMAIGGATLDPNKAINAEGLLYGVYGTSGQYGVYGLGTAGYGVYGQTSTGYGIYGESTSNGYSGYFTGGKGLKVEGNTNITGELTVGESSTFINGSHVIADYVSGNGSGLTSVTASYATSAGTATTASAVPWSGITSMPAGFSDGVDNTAGCTYLGGVTTAWTTVAIPIGHCANGGGCELVLISAVAQIKAERFTYYSGTSWATSGGSTGTNGDSASSIIETTPQCNIADDFPGIETSVSYFSLWSSGAPCYVYAC